MPMYAVATLPTIKRLPKSTTQVWYTVNASAFGTITDLQQWWDEVTLLWLLYPNPSKTWLVTKEKCHPTEVAAFQATNINVASSGRPYLGTTLDMASYTDQFVAEKIAQLVGEVRRLSAIATQQHAVNPSALCQG